MLAELQRAGIEFHFVPDSRNLDRFGDSRCAEAGRYQRLLLISGPNPELAPGSVVVAEVAGITAEELAEYETLQQRFGDLLRDGSRRRRRRHSTDSTPGSVEELRAVVRTPDLRGDGTRPSAWTAGGDQVSSRSRHRNEDAFDRWFELERRSSADYQTIVLEQPSAADDRRC